jgi:CheY-like chemotaxis protein
LHQVLLNLCVNARDAMPSGGKLTLSAQNIKFGPEESALPKAVPGPYVMLSVADTGSGIPHEVLPRIFEPFFTTKLPDKGTGLGLSTVATIVKNRGGCIDVQTEMGKGTEFRVYVPAIETAAQAAKIEPAQELPAGRGELILVIEDEEAVRELTKTTLENYGYRVITAQNGVQGISRFEERMDEVDALISDTDLPFMDGLAAVNAIKGMKPGLPVIITSGSKQDTERRRRLDIWQLTNLGKPFSAEQLLITLATVLQKPALSSPAAGAPNWSANPAGSIPWPRVPSGCLGA